MNKILIVLGLLIIFSVIASATPSYIVTNAGTTACNGNYSVYSENDGVTSYKHDSANYYLYRHQDFTGPVGRGWGIGPYHGAVGTAYYIVASTSDTPYIGTYGYENGDEPDAVVSAVPEFFGIHFEWFDLSGGLIAAILAIALPMFLFKRKKL